VPGLFRYPCARFGPLGILSLLATSFAVIQIWMSAGQRILLTVPFVFYLGFKVSSLRYPEFNVLGEAILGGRIRQWLRHLILLRILEGDLKAAKESTSALEVLEKAAEQLGLIDLNVRLPGAISLPIVTLPDLASSYLVRIDLPGRCWVNFRVPVHLKRTENPASDFAAIVIRTLNSQRLEKLEQTTEANQLLHAATLLSDQSG